MTVCDTRVTPVDVMPASATPAVAPRLGIGELSARTGASARSLRYYEQQGLLAAARTAAGHRRYDAEAMDRVLLVQRLLAVGLSSAEISPLLPLLLGRDPAQETGLDALRAHRRELAARIARLQDTAEILDEVLEEHAAAR
ncbi:MerR family transcriptional regulator [Brachybacterium saurashtrense]|nr:MerR family transcriptional regulator [Brachybacterium saurashtrense]